MKLNFTPFTVLMLLLLSGCSLNTPKPKVIQTAIPLQAPLEVVDKNSSVIPVNKNKKVFQNCFRTGRVTLAKSCKKEVDSFLKERPLEMKRVILISVYTDKKGPQAKNLKISRRRAYKSAASLYFKEYLHSKVYYAGFGEQNPLVDSESPEANLINRRLEVEVKEKNSAIDTKIYRLYKKESVKKRRKIRQKKKVTSVDIIKHTGKADTGWIYFGDPSLAKKFHISCMQDREIKVKRRAIRGHSKSEFMPKIYNTTWSASVDNYNFKLAPVSVYDDGYLPRNNPNIILYKNGKLLSVLETKVNAYRGLKGMLYRVFIQGNVNEMKCMDLIVPYASETLEEGTVYMQKNGKVEKKELLIKHD